MFQEYMRVMGMRQWISWLAYFVLNYVKAAVAAVVTAVLMYVYPCFRSMKVI